MNATISRICRIGKLPVVKSAPHLLVIGLASYCQAVFGYRPEGRVYENMHREARGMLVDPDCFIRHLSAEYPDSFVVARKCPRNGWQPGTAVFLEHLHVSAPYSGGMVPVCSLVKAVFDWAAEIGASEVYASSAKGATSLLESASRKTHNIYEIEV